MAIRYVTGISSVLKPRLIGEIGRAMAEGEHALALIVPAQYALQAEIDVLGGLNAPGSFRLQVLPPERLYSRIFEQAGQPDAVRISAQGRVMLMHAALREVGGKLAYYRRAQHKPGFAERAVIQIARFKQSGLAPEALREMAAQQESAALADKLTDLATLYAAYENLLSGRFIDEDDEAREAIARLNDAPFLNGCEAWFYGFDLLSPSVADTFIALSGVARQVTLVLALEQDGNAADFDVYKPVQQSFERMHRQVLDQNLAWERVYLKETQVDERPADIRHIERSLYGVPLNVYPDAPKNVHLAALKNPQDEAEYCAAVVRHLVMTRGWRYSDITVACQDLNRHAETIQRAFELYNVPIFLSESRLADRHPLSNCLLTALRAVTRGFRTEDMLSLIRTGFTALSDDEADRVINYAIETGLRGKSWQNPLTRGDEDRLAELEPLREKLVAPLVRLRDGLRAAQTGKDRLAAVYGFLTELGARETIEEMQARLVAENRRVWAMEGAQVWNRIIEALDQMHELLGDRLKTRDLYPLLLQALSSTVIKALPQSGDAVSGGSISHIKTKPVRALMLVGVTDQPASGEESLLSDEEKEALHRMDNKIWLGLSASGRGKLNRLNVKSLVGNAREFMHISYFTSDAAGKAVKDGSLIQSIRRMFPKLTTHSDIISENDAYRRLRLNAPDAALSLVPAMLRSNPEDRVALSALKALSASPAHREDIAAIRASYAYRVASPPLKATEADDVYGILDRVSISRLEEYAKCPFRHFTKYGLNPQPVRPLELSYSDMGNFYHKAIERFMAESTNELTRITPADSAERMDAVTEKMFEEVTGRFAEEDAVTLSECRAMRSVARKAAQMIVKQMAGSRFSPGGVEIEFGRGAASVRIGNSVLSGRIDRVDEWAEDDQRFLRVIDYKTRGKNTNLSDIYYGLELQLMIYLAAALAARGGEPAGALYFAIDEPMVKTDERDPAEIEKLSEKELRMQGVLLSDEEVIAAMAEEPEKAIKIVKRADGNLLEAEDFGALIRHTLDTAEAMLARIQDGDTRVAPYESRTRSGCDYCEYKAICHYEKALPGAKPRKLKPLTKSEVIEKLRDE